MAKCRVKECTKTIWQRDLKEGRGIKLTHNGINMYFCCEEHCKQYMSELKEKEQYYKERDDIDRYVKENLFFYFDGQKLPKYFFDRIADLNNGTVRTNGRVIRNGQRIGYPMPVILETFKQQRDNILYHFRHKDFQKESQKINYMLAIIEGNINDVYETFKRNEIVAREVKNVDLISMDFEETMSTPVVNTNEVKDLRKLFDLSDIL